MASIAGKVAPVPKGAWDSITPYEKLNIVSHNGYVYMAKDDNTGHEPVSGASDTYWMLLVSGGVVSVDSAMSTTSTNPVQNKVIGTALDTAKDESQEVVTDQYNSATNYDVMGNANGYPSFCISGDVLYKCKTACVGVAPPNVTYWEATSVGDELSSVNSELSDLSNSVWELSTYSASIKTSSGTVTCRKRGDVVVVNFIAFVPSASNATYSNFIPSGFRPSDSQTRSVLSTVNGAIGVIQISDDGSLAINGFTTSNTYWGSIIYVV